MTGKIKKIISIENGDSFVADIEDIENRITQNSSNLETAKTELSNKCNEALSEAKAYTDTEKAKLFNSTNGTFTGQEYFRDVNNSVLRFNGGNTHDGGASLMLYAKNADRASGYFDLVASTKEDTSDAKQLVGTPAGQLTWDSKNIVRSVNGVNADDNGNVLTSDFYENGDGYIRFTNGLQFCFNSANTSNPNVSFPKPFSSTPLVLCSGSGNPHGWGSSNLSLTGFTVICNNESPGQYCYFFAIGYWK